MYIKIILSLIACILFEITALVSFAQSSSEAIVLTIDTSSEEYYIDSINRIRKTISKDMVKYFDHALEIIKMANKLNDIHGKNVEQVIELGRLQTLDMLIEMDNKIIQELISEKEKHEKLIHPEIQKLNGYLQSYKTYTPQSCQRVKQTIKMLIDNYEKSLTAHNKCTNAVIEHYKSSSMLFIDLKSKHGASMKEILENPDSDISLINTLAIKAEKEINNICDYSILQKQRHGIVAQFENLNKQCIREIQSITKK